MSVKKYLKIDSEKGYLENKDDINYFATNQLRKVSFGKMLGDFDENGVYVINAKIVEELIRMPKVIVDVVDETDLIRSTVKADAFFHFILTVEDNKASFKLLEKMKYQSNRDFNAGSYSNINEYIIDEVIVPDKDFDRNALYQKYNISTEKNDDVLSIFDMDELSLALYYNIVEKLKIDYLVQIQMLLKEKELEEIEANYFEEVLAIFDEFKEFGEKITNDVKNELAEKHTFVIASKPFFQHTVNEILDSFIDQYISELSPEQKELFLAKWREAKASYYRDFKKALPIEIIQKAGVRFDPNMIVEEALIGSLAKEISTKGFTSSDIRRLLINEDELQLSINKIKEMLQENEEVCKRDNAKAKDIINNRDKTTKFYEELEKQKKVDILKPDTTLIETTINKNDADKTKKQEVVKDKTVGDKNVKKPNVSVKSGSVKGGSVKGSSAKASGGKKTGSAKGKNAGATAGNNTKKGGSSEVQNTTTTKSQKIYYFGGTTSTKKIEPSKNNSVLDEITTNGEARLAERMREGLKTGTSETKGIDSLIR